MRGIAERTQARAGRASGCLRGGCLTIFVLYVLCGPLAAQDGAVPSPAPVDLGSIALPLVLSDPTGQAVTVPTDPQCELLVLVFVGTECPLVRRYLPRLTELAQHFPEPRVMLVGIDSNAQDAPSELAQLAREFSLRWPLLHDPAHHIADQLAATRTPEAVVLDRQGTVRYRGRIDDQFGIGFQRAAPRREDLYAALGELLGDQPVQIPRTEPVGCLIGRRRTPVARSPVTWNGEIAPIVRSRCGRCHRPGSMAPFSLLEYADASAWQAMIAEVVAAGRMPPWHANPEFGRFANDPRLSTREREHLLTWVEHGAPLGDDPARPESEVVPPGAAPTWKIGEPDQIVYMRAQPFDVPATGQVDYQWFEVDPQFHEDRWIRAAEAVPGAPQVVHHITVYFHPPGEKWDLRLNDRVNLLGGFNPGGTPWMMPPGLAMRIPAGAQIVFEMHYAPNGRATPDRSAIGLKFADPAQVRREIHTLMPANTDFAIPPAVADYQVDAQYEMPADVDLLLLRPHMHLRGKSFRYEARFADGRREILLDVPQFDFNWQHSYVLAEPKRLPLGTTLYCTAHFDNSADNPHNPLPEATVRWGDQSHEEMMIGIAVVALANQDLLVERARTDNSAGKAPPLHEGRIWALALVIATMISGVVGWLWWRPHRPRPSHLSHDLPQR